MDTNEQVQFELVDVPITNAGNTQFNFNTDQVLEQAKKILAIETYKVGGTSVSPITGNAVVSDTVFAKSFLTIVSKTQTGKQIISQMPLVDLYRPDNSGIMEALNIQDKINVTKCFITTADNTSNVASTSFLLGFHYVDGNS